MKHTRHSKLCKTLMYPKIYCNLIFEVRSLLIKNGPACSAAMWTFPINSIKHPIAFWILWNQYFFLDDWISIHWQFLIVLTHFQNVLTHFLNLLTHLRNKYHGDFQKHSVTQGVKILSSWSFAWGKVGVLNPLPTQVPQIAQKEPQIAPKLIQIVQKWAQIVQKVPHIAPKMPYIAPIVSQSVPNVRKMPKIT